MVLVLISPVRRCCTSTAAGPTLAKDKIMLLMKWDAYRSPIHPLNSKLFRFTVSNNSFICLLKPWQTPAELIPTSFLNHSTP